jgi:hypothetical protein
MAKPKPKRSIQNEPSAASLRDVPELDPATTVKFGRGMAAMRDVIDFMNTVRGRPKHGAKAAGSSVRSLRLTDQAWAELERRAEQLGMPLHKLLRVVIAGWLYGDAGAKKIVKQHRRRNKAA